MRNLTHGKLFDLDEVKEKMFSTSPRDVTRESWLSTFSVIPGISMLFMDLRVVQEVQRLIFLYMLEQFICHHLSGYPH